MKLHAEYVKAQMQALAEQARDLAQHAAKAANAARKEAERPLRPGLVLVAKRHSCGHFCAMQYLILHCNIGGIIWSAGRFRMGPRGGGRPMKSPGSDVRAVRKPRAAKRSETAGAKAQVDTRKPQREDHHHV